MKNLAATLPIAFLMVSPAQAATTIDFEGQTGSVTSYTESGVTFTAGAVGFTFSTSPNGTTGIIANQASGGRPEYIASLSFLTNFVSVDLGDFGADSDLLFLEVFDVSSNLLGSDSLSISSSVTTMQTLSVAVNGIASARFGARAPAVNGNSVFADNFTFRSVQAAVPEPATWAMMLLGFGFVGGAMRSTKRRQKVTVSYA